MVWGTRHSRKPQYVLMLLEHKGVMQVSRRAPSAVALTGVRKCLCTIVEDVRTALQESSDVLAPVQQLLEKKYLH